MKAFLTVVIAFSSAVLLFGGSAAAQQPSTRRNTQIETLDLDAAEEETVDEKNSRQLGTITLEQEEKRQDPYVVNQDAAIAFMEKLQQTMAGLERGEMTAPPTVTDDALSHIAAGYLFCSAKIPAKNGICPEWLEALREVDVINAIVNGNTDQKRLCATMKRFWGVWLKNDMQKKLNFQVQFGQVRARTEFNRTTLPSFVPPGCEKAVGALVEEASSGKPAFFAKRYQGGTGPAKAASSITEMLKYFKTKNYNLFAATMPR